MSKLSRAERNEILMMAAKNVEHPDYYVIQKKDGSYQVRKRKVPLSHFTQHPEDNSTTEVVTSPEETKKEEDTYDVLTNRMIAERLLQLLEQNVISNDKNLSAPENSIITQDNQQFNTNFEDRVVNNLPQQDDVPNPNHYLQQTVLQPRCSYRPRVLRL